MTSSLVDPRLAAWESADPAAFLEQEQPPPLPPLAPLITRHDVERDLAVAIVVMAGLVVRDIMRNRGGEEEDLQEVARGSWRGHVPMWLRLTAPAIKHAYVLGKIDGLTGDELDHLATAYAADLGDYVNQTSAQALQEGLQIQLNQRWSYRLARERAASGYGLDSQQMQTYLKSVIKVGEDSVDPVPAIGRTIVSKLLLKRADRIAHQEAYTAEETGKSLSWMYIYQQGQLAGAKKEWDLGEDEHHCPICLELAGQQVRPDESFMLANGTIVWAPRAHPGCTCRLRLLNAAGEEIAKAATIAAGLCVRAKDTGRVLMLQRGLSENDPAAGMWEFPGGHLDEGEDPEVAAAREWCEEVGHKIPRGKNTGHWQSGIYEGFVHTIARESDVDLRHGRGAIPNPDGDDFEAVAWWEPGQLARNPALRSELRQALPKVREALGDVQKAYQSDPFDRDWHGRFAAHEGRRSTATLTQPIDTQLYGLIQEIRTAPSLATEAKSLGRTRQSLGQKKSLQAPASLAAPAALGVTTSMSAMVAQRQKQAQGVHIRIHIKLPEIPPLPSRPDEGGFFVPMDDVARWYDDTDLDRHNPDVNFGEIAEYYRSGIVDEPQEHIRIEARFHRSAWNTVYPQVDGYDQEEWDDMMAKAKPIWDTARAHAEEILYDEDGLDDYELSYITNRAFHGDHSSESARLQIIDNLDSEDDPDHSLADAYADYVTFVRPELTQPWRHSREVHDFTSVYPGGDAMEANPPVTLRITKLARDDDAANLSGNYLMAGGRYISALAEGVSIPGHMNLREVELEPHDE